MASALDVKERLCARWPGRREQISQLLGLIGEPYDSAMPVFVHGPPVTGKSSIVRDVLGTLGRPFAYTSLVDSHGPRLLLDALVEELAPNLRGLDEKDLRCANLADLVQILRKGLPEAGPAVFLVIDEATRVLDWRGGEHLLPALMKLAELTGRNVGCVLVATQGWDAFRTAGGARPPVPVFFDAYTKAQLLKVLLLEKPIGADERLYAAFVSAVLPMFVATCKSLHELRAMFVPLWGRYVLPWELAKARIEEVDTGGANREQTSADHAKRTEEKLPEPRQLFAALQSGNTANLANRANPETDTSRTLGGVASGTAGVPSSTDGLDGDDDRREQQGQEKHQQRRRPFLGPVLHAGLAVPLSAAALALGEGRWPVAEDVFSGAGKLDFDIPRLTKFMLISAHLATMNKEGVDKRLFGHMVEGTRAGTAAIRAGGKRRRGAATADRQQDNASVAALEGPGAFNLERLLAYFRIVTKQAYDEDDAGSSELARELLSADVFMQISSMVALGLLTKVSGADALDSVRYRCDIGDDLARKIAANLRVNLDNYLFYT
jgi:origin recognition complex subunit 5